MPPTVLPLGSLPITEDASSPSMGEGSCPVGEAGNLLSGPLLFSWVSWLLSSGQEREKMPQVFKSASLKGDLITRPPCLYQDHKPPWQVHMDQKGHILEHPALFKCGPGLLPSRGPAKMALERISIYGDTGTYMEWFLNDHHPLFNYHQQSTNISPCRRPTHLMTSKEALSNRRGLGFQNSLFNEIFRSVQIAYQIVTPEGYAYLFCFC